jgi:hypothetical protein
MLMFGAAAQLHGADLSPRALVGFGRRRPRGFTNPVASR